MTKLVVLWPDQPPEERSAPLDPQPGYHALRDLVTPLLNGADMEHVSVLHEGQPRDMFVDDEGAIKRLPRNDAATAIYRSYWLSKHPSTDPEDLDAIYGPAVLFLRRVWF